MIRLPEHLGGHAGMTHIDSGVLDFVKSEYDIKTAYDIGCGVGGMVELMSNNGIDVTGIDGDFTLTRNTESSFITHDFTIGELDIPSVDFGWSVEFLEHIEEPFIDNVFSVFNQCKYMVVTAAPPSTSHAHHHVNCRDVKYWIGIFADHGFRFSSEMTANIRRVSTMKREFMRNTGMFFENLG